MPSSPAVRYRSTTIALHWLMAVLLVGSFALGLYMSGLPLSPQRLKLFSWHKWAGVLLLLMAGWRLLARLRQPRLPAPPGTGWQRAAAQATHAGLYLLFFAVPLAGWTYSSAAGFPVVLFGLLPLPDLVPVDKALAAAIKPWHERLAFAMAALVLMHVAAALKHHFIDRDGLLARMSPGRR